MLLSLCRNTGTEAVLPSFAPRAATEPLLEAADASAVRLPSLLACILDAPSSCAWETPRGPTTVLAMQLMLSLLAGFKLLFRFLAELVCASE